MIVFNFHRGDDKVYEITVKDKVSEIPIDITGCTLKMTLRKTYSDAIFIQKTFVLTDPTNGKAEVAIDAADTASLPNVKAEYLFDVEILKTTAKKETLLFGKFTILPEVTY